MDSNPKDVNEILEPEIKSEDKKTSDVPQENKQLYQRYYKSKSFMPKFTGKSIKSGASSFTNDSSLNNDPLSSSRDSEEKRIKRGIDIEYPTLKRSHSTKKYHYSKGRRFLLFLRVKSFQIQFLYYNAERKQLVLFRKEKIF